MAYTNTDQIGEITEITGNATIIRTDGTQEPITLGTEVFQGDIIETEGDGAVNIGFVDDSSFAVSNDARIAIDEFVFDPETEAGSQDFSVVRGVFMYTSGLIGRENPDQVEIDTPVGSIGIRGTIIGGNINPDGESTVSVLEGAIVVRNNGGEQLLTNQYEMVKLISMDVAPSVAQQMTVSDIAQEFSAIKNVSANLFSSFEDQMQQEAEGAESVSEGLDNAENAADAQDEADAEADSEVNAEESTDDPVSDMMMDGETSETSSLESPTTESAEIRQGSGADRQGQQSNITAGGQQNDPSSQPAPDIIERLADNNNGNNNGNSNGPADPIIFPNFFGLVENADGSTTNITVATVALQSGNPNVIFEVLDTAGNPHPTLFIDAGGNLLFDGSDSGDFDAGDEIIYTIRAIDDTTSEVISEQSFTLDLLDIDESAEITAHTVVDDTIIDNDETTGGLATDQVVADLDFIEVDAHASFQTQFSTNDPRFAVQENAGQMQLVALAGSVFDYESDPATITVEITQTDTGNVYATYDIPFNIVDINDETPAITNNTMSVDEEATITIDSTMLSAIDGDSLDNNSTLHFKITNLPMHGTLYINGAMAEIGVVDSFTMDNVIAGEITYTHDGSENHSDNFGFYVEDDAGNQTGASSFNINVNPMNDAPVIDINSGMTIDEDEVDVVIDDTMLSISDVDISDDPSNIHIKVTSLPTNGVLLLSGAPMVLGTNDTFTMQNILDGLITYSHNGTETLTDSFDFEVTDGGENGVTAQADTFTISVTDDAATLSLASQDNFSATGPADAAAVRMDDAGGVRIAKIEVDDIYGEDFEAVEFIVQSGLDAYFEVIKNVNDDYILKLKSGYQIMDDGVNFGIYDDAPTPSQFHILGANDSPFTVDIGLFDAGATQALSIDVMPQLGVQDIVGSAVADLIFTGDRIAIGDEDNNLMRIDNTDFKFITGGEGYDTLLLNGDPNGGAIATFDMTSKADPFAPAVFSADLASIEEIRFTNDALAGDDVLKFNVQDIIRLLRTSESGIVKIATDSDSALNNNINFYDASAVGPGQLGSDGPEVSIGDPTVGIQGAFGFTKVDTDFDDGSGEDNNFVVYNHAEGQLLIETNIDGSQTGGL